MDRRFQLLLEKLQRAEASIVPLPAGRDLGERIRSVLQSPPGDNTGVSHLWAQLGFDLVLCTGFPEEVFEALRVTGDFDIRWPLTFACHYWGQTSASVDSACATWLRNAGLWEPARAVLPEYTNEHTGEEWVDAWRKRFVGV